MPAYKVPLREFRFAIHEVLGFPEHYAGLPGCEEASTDTVDAILDEAAKFVDNDIAPLHRVGDQQGCQWQDTVVTTPEGFKAAYDTFVENGWPGLAQPTEYGGQGMPVSMNTFLMEMLATGNHAWCMYPSLTWGAISTLLAHGDDNLKATCIQPLVEGRWSGTMCLTEAHCGSDLGMLRTKAEPVADGSYTISGTKIFISAGEHDLTDNIIHIVLARLVDAPQGTKGISLFAVPKFTINDDGSLGDRNTVSCGSIEHKMGIHGNATCVMNFDKARGYLIGEPNRGLNHMFTFINESRLGVAQQGQGAIEHAFQGALAYARERLQMRAPVRKLPAKPADPIIVHPDVRRMLLTQKALTEGGRLLNYYCAKQLDICHYSPDEEQRKRAETLLSLLTPVAKGFLTEMGIEAANHGIQVFGGHGFISEWGMEQIARDVRITTLYEGTTGIQGIDLLGRKVLPGGGKLLVPFVTEIKTFIEQHNTDKRLKPLLETLDNKVDSWLELTKDIATAASKDPNEVNAAAYDYLMFSGYITLAYFWAKSAQVALSAGDSDFYNAKLTTAHFYFERLLPRTETLATTIRSGAKNLMSLDDDAFAF